MFLRMVARPLMAKVKQTTGIKKVPEPNLKEVLIGLFNQILNELKKLPEYNRYRQYVEKDMNYAIKVCREEEDVDYITRWLCHRPVPVEELIEEVRLELSQVSGSIADWLSCEFQYPPPTPISRQKILLAGQYGKPNKRELLIQLYNDALKVVRKVPEKNKLRMFAECSITRKLTIIEREDDWESIKNKLNYEDPIQKAGEELDHWSLFFGPDAYPNRLYPNVPRTKEFVLRFDAWRELAYPENWRPGSTPRITNRYSGCLP